jgi:Uma2 family endonuclease
MAPDSREIDDQPTEPENLSNPMKDWYDRSSLLGDFMVMIADQTVEDYMRRCPENKFCEYIDGVVYLHPSALDGIYEERVQRAAESGEPVDPMNDWYDRSSLVGDFMVMIADQTVEDYMRRCPENKFCEYIDGTVYMPSPAELWHQFDSQFLVFLLEGFNATHQFGHILTGPASLKLREGCLLEPDLFVIPFDAEGNFQGFFREPPVLLVIEVLSRSTRSSDLNRKAELYRQARTPEVWFLDPRDRALIVYRLMDVGYEVERVEIGTYASRAIPGFWIDTSWLWARPRPNVMTCLQAILAGPPA